MVRDSFDEEKEPKINIISRIFCILFLFTSIFTYCKIFALNIIPTKYLLLSLILLVIFNYIFILTTFRRRTSKTTLIVFNILSVIFSLAFIFLQIKVGEITNFITKNFDEGNDKYAIYHVIVSKESNISNFRELNGKELFTYEEPVKEVSNEDLNNSVQNVIADSTLTFKNDLDIVMNRVTKMTGTASVVNNGTFESYISVNQDYPEQIRIIGEIKIKIKDNVDTSTSAREDTIADKPFIMYISGIDTRTNTMPSRALSDVNILAAIDAQTKKILLINIPRDSYVLIHGDSGLNDKLTHAGSRGGVDLSIATIEDLMSIKIDKYIRVNFNFLQGLVDQVGGIAVNSSEDHTYKTLHGNCVINPGENFLNGNCALGFVRERKALTDGDIQRGKNQIQVIKRLFEKISKDENLITRYNDYLNSLNGSFDTNISSNDINVLIKSQLEDMSGWTIETYSIEGNGTMGRTHSYPNQDLYIMHVDQNMLSVAKAKIKSYLNK